ncbi:hypothetical protein NHF48_009945 [Sphingomonas sp. H160509]|nr:hypothetical protein [Sphingomonas sp. H160509]MDD1451224.1 hypothetical protein [Sphingomonas sp. H160509]
MKVLRTALALCVASSGLAVAQSASAQFFFTVARFLGRSRHR